MHIIYNYFGLLLGLFVQTPRTGYYGHPKRHKHFVRYIEIFFDFLAIFRTFHLISWLAAFRMRNVRGRRRPAPHNEYQIGSEYSSWKISIG
jgi:desulfoferrodoxin (superoxide reductase-like protein)